MHPRRLRCSSLKYSRYSRSSRLAGGAPPPSRCDARLSSRAASEASPQTAKRGLGSNERVVTVAGLQLLRHSGEPSDGDRCAVVWNSEDVWAGGHWRGHVGGTFSE